ncbi:hypothetical protein CC2G_011675 [Coprinopsis cinerea AmutBmut pab1-1]|nr:hypothetical protein CC2G_011675 [Coprinopsis cinerea AmutBmut pab1-1]
MSDPTEILSQIRDVITQWLAAQQDRTANPSSNDNVTVDGHSGVDNAPHIPATSSDTGGPVTRWYAVLVGRQPGVFCGSATIPQNVKGIPGSSVFKCTSEEEAQEVYNSALRSRTVERVTIIREILEA